MRKSLAWTLAASVALSAAALWQPHAPEPVLAVMREAAGQARQVKTVAGLRPAAAQPVAVPGLPADALPAQWPMAALGPAGRDPFQAGAPATPAMVSAPAPAPPPLLRETAPPEAPPMTYRFIGRFTAPDGQARVFLGQSTSTGQGEGAVVEAGAGYRLESGWTVESVSAEGVVLVYPALGSRYLLPVPPQ